jgi:hypothetical protein
MQGRKINYFVILPSTLSGVHCRHLSYAAQEIAWQWVYILNMRHDCAKQHTYALVPTTAACIPTSAMIVVSHAAG